jgi:hypothetical protein
MSDFDLLLLNIGLGMMALISSILAYVSLL